MIFDITGEAMRFVIDLDLLQVIRAANDKSPVVSAEGKRGDDTPFEVVYVRNGVAEELNPATVITFGAKPLGKYDAGVVVMNSDFTLSGSGSTAKYLANPSFNTEALNALFLIDEDDSNDPPYVDLMAEFTWQVGTGAPSSTRTFIFRVHNDVIRDESAPTELPTPDDWLESRRPSPLLLTAPPEDGVTPGALGQLAIVTTTNSLSGSPITHRDVWHCTATNTWTPPGHITRDRSTSDLIRIYTVDGGPETELAYP